MCGVFESNRKKLHLLSGVAEFSVALVDIIDFSSIFMID